MDETERISQFKSTIDYLSEIDIDKIKTDGMSLRLGDKMVVFKCIEDNPISVEDEIRAELKEKINSQQIIIRDKINTKISEMINYFNQIKREYRRKEKELKETLDNASPMPEIYFKHAQAGLSVLKGQGRQLTWLVQGIYWPKTIDGKKIEAKFSKKMISPVTFMIDTRDSKVMDVSTRQPIGLDYFQHYHQSNPDCWGKWKHAKSFKTPEDIIRIAKDAEAVLENINTGSIAIQSPSGLPRKSTILKHIIGKDVENKIGALNQQVRRSGITSNIRSNDNDVWGWNT